MGRGGRLEKVESVGFFDGLLHLLNFFAPALGVGLLTATLVKLVWRQALRGTSWGRLAMAGCTACGLALLVGLLFFGRDGKMATYGLMLLLCTLSIGWFGLRRATR